VIRNCSVLDGTISGIEKKNSRASSLTKKTIRYMELNETAEQLRLLQLIPHRSFMNSFHVETKIKK
jgi:hypothetical protein